MYTHLFGFRFRSSPLTSLCFLVSLEGIVKSTPALFLQLALSKSFSLNGPSLSDKCERQEDLKSPSGIYILGSACLMSHDTVFDIGEAAMNSPGTMPTSTGL